MVLNSNIGIIQIPRPGRYLFYILYIEYTYMAETTLGIRKKTKERFNAFGAKGETDDELLNRIMDELLEYRRRCG